MKIKILVTPNCSGCKIVKDYFDKMKIKYKIIDMVKNPEVLQKYCTMSAPTIVINEKVEFIGTPSEKELRDLIKREGVKI
ncbi:MAG: thioredoxin family protein [Nanoarchaeota archaeon]